MRGFRSEISVLQLPETDNIRLTFLWFSYTFIRFKKVAVDTLAAKADDLFQSRIGGQIDLKHPLIILG